MISKEAAAAAEMLKNGRKMRSQGKAPEGDPQFLRIQGIYAERNMLNERAKSYVLPDKLSLEYETAEGVHGEWLRYLSQDPEKDKEKIILFAHGGGFASGSALSRRSLAAKLALASKMDLYSLDYRQCPEYKFPAPVDDMVTVFLWLLKKGYAPQNIMLFGESAGANLVLALPLYLKDHYLPLPGAVCAFSPPVDMFAKYDSRITKLKTDAMIGADFDDSEIPKMLEELRAQTEPRDSLYCSAQEVYSPYASPIRGDLSGFPRLMIQVGELEPLYDDAVDLAAKAKAAGVEVVYHEWEGLFHVFALFDCPETTEVCQEIAQFFKGGN